MKINEIHLLNPHIIFLASLLLIAGCNKQDDQVVPGVALNQISALTDNSVNCSGSLSNNSVSVASVQGVCWSTSENPTISDNKTSDILGKYSKFNSSPAELQPVTTYYIRAYVTISNKTSYSEQQSFTTLSTVKDIEGNEYHTVKIGQQIWMKENLKTTKYQNGDDIGTTSPANLDISAENEPEYQWTMPGSDDYLQTYGKLYTWYTAVDPRNVCPSGWHVPDNANWNTLLGSMNNPGSAGTELKETGSVHWDYANIDATNQSGFTALGAGYRHKYGGFGGTASLTAFWSMDFNSPSQGFCFQITSSVLYANLVNGNSTEKTYGYSIRCLKDE